MTDPAHWLTPLVVLGGAVLIFVVAYLLGHTGGREAERNSLAKSPPIPPRSLRCILVPTDFSAEAERAIDYGASLALEVGAKLFLLHVHPRQMPEDVDDPVFPTRHDLYLDGAAARIRALGRELVKRRVHYYGHVAEGDPATEIVTFAKLLDADMIVLGSHERNRLDRMLEGSVTTQVLRNAPCPVLAAPPAGFVAGLAQAAHHQALAANPTRLVETSPP